MAYPTGIALQPDSRTPVFRQIADQLAQRIEAGLYPPGHRLPPSRSLARELGTHRNTVVRAYDALAADRYVQSTVGRGTFVVDVRRAALPATADSEPGRAELPWGALLSRVGSAEPLGRVERLPRHASEDLIDLTRMQPSEDLLPAEHLRLCLDHVLRQRGPGALGYAPREGLPRLRQLIADDLARAGVPAAPDDVIVTTGSQQALDLVARALVNPGDRFLVEAETYSGAINLMSAVQARLVSVPGDQDGPDLATLRLLAPGAKGLYLMPACRNPTGSAISAERRRALVDWSHEAGVPLVEDDYGADLDLDGLPTPPALRALDRDVIYVSTFSKRLIPALRLGFVLVPPALHRPLLALKHTMDLGTSALLQHALAEFLERGYLQAHLRRLLPVYRARRDAAEDAMARYLPDAVRWHHVERGVVLWLALPPNLHAEAVFAEAQRRGVLVSPGTLHTASGRDQSGVRLTLCNTPSDRLCEGIRRLGDALHALLAARPVGSGLPPTTVSSV